MPIIFIYILFQWNLVTFNCAVLFSNYVFIFPTKVYFTRWLTCLLCYNAYQKNCLCPPMKAKKSNVTKNFHLRSCIVLRIRDVYPGSKFLHTINHLFATIRTSYIFWPSWYLTLSPGNTVNINYVSILLSSYVITVRFSVFTINKVMFFTSLNYYHMW